MFSRVAGDYQYLFGFLFGDVCPPWVQYILGRDCERNYNSGDVITIPQINM
jgi:hypothetical protein